MVAGVAAGWSAQARRSSTGVLVAAAAVTAVGAAILLGLVTLLLLLGRLPAGAERRVVGPAVVAIVVAAACAGPFARRAARRTRAAMHAVRRSPDELLADFAENAGRGSPVDDLLRTLAESMRRDWQLARVEVWTGLDDPTASLAAGPTRACTARSSCPARWTPTPTPCRPRSSPPNWACCAEWAWPGRAGCGCGCPACSTATRTRVRWPTGSCASRRPCTAAASWRWWSSSGRRTRCRSARPTTGRWPRSPAGWRSCSATAAWTRRCRPRWPTCGGRTSDLQASRRRLVTTADAERKRIERDLHDGAQQHLVALAVGIRLVRDSLAACASPADIELLDELDRGVRESIGSLRDLAHGIYPPLLRDSGLEEALRAAAKRSPLPVTVSASNLGRHPEQVEAAVYFCCLEALANAGKHAPGSTVTITLQAVPGELRFEVADSGPGFDPATTPAGAGLSNMADRIGALGGEIAWRAAPGHGTVVVGRTPVPRASHVPAARPAVPVGD